MGEQCRPAARPSSTHGQSSVLLFPLLIPRVGADSGALRCAPDPTFTRLHWPFASFSLCQGPSMLGLGVEKLLAGGGGLLIVPGLTVTRRGESQGKQSPRKTHTPAQSGIQTLAPRPEEGNTSSCKGTQHHMINKQGPGKPQGHLLPFPPFRDTCKHLCRERGSHLRNEHTHTSPPCSIPAPNSHVMARVHPNSPHSIPLSWLCLPHIISGENRQETRGSRVPHSMDTFPRPQESPPRITTLSSSTLQAGPMQRVLPPPCELAQPAHHLDSL